MLAACSRDSPHGAGSDATAQDAAASDAADDAGGPPPPRPFDAGHRADAALQDAEVDAEPIEVRCTEAGAEQTDGLELVASDGLLEAFTVRAQDDAVFATVGADLGGGLLHRVVDGQLERFGEAVDEVDALHVAGDELFVAISRDDDPGVPLVVAKLDATTGAREDLATDAALREARALAVEGDWVYCAADKATDPPGGRVFRAPRAGGASELISELPAMFLPEGARFAEDSLRVRGALLVYIGRVNDFSAVFRGPSERMAGASLISGVPAMDGLPAGLPTDVGVELDEHATYVAFAHNATWTGPQGITRIPHDEARGDALFETGTQQILGLTSDAESLYWMMRNREGTTSLLRGSKSGDAPRELATGFHWTRGLAVTDRYVYFVLSDCPRGDGVSLVRIPKR